MPFGTITSQTKSYEPREPGIYMNDTVSFGDPEDYYKIKGATEGKDGLLRGSFSRILEKDVTVGSETIRKQLLVSVLVVAPEDGFTAAEAASLLTDSANFGSADNISRVLQKES